MVKEREYAKAVLQNYFKLKERCYLGDIDATEALIDLERAIKLAELTERQREAIHYRYICDYTQEKCAEILGISRITLLEHERLALQAINEVYIMWAYRDEAEEMAQC